MNIITLREVLTNPNYYSWKDSMYLPSDKNWNLDSDCVVVNLDDLDDDEEQPEGTKELNLIFALNTSEIQGIYENLNEQTTELSDEILLRAFLYYYKNDAFIEL